MSKTLRDLLNEATAKPLDIPWERVYPEKAPPTNEWENPESDLPWETESKSSPPAPHLEEEISYIYASQSNAELVYLRLIHGEDVFLLLENPDPDVGYPKLPDDMREEWIGKLEREILYRYQMMDVGTRYLSITGLLTK